MGTLQGLPHPQIDVGWVVIEGLLVLVLGGVSERMRALILSRERALAYASRALERMRLDTDTIVQNLGSGLLSVDRNGGVVHVNRAAEETLSIRADDVRGREAAKALPPDLLPLVQTIVRSLATREPVRRAEIDVVCGGRTVPLGLGTTILFDTENEPSGVVALFQDLTAVRHQESLARTARSAGRGRRTRRRHRSRDSQQRAAAERLGADPGPGTHPRRRPGQAVRGDRA